MRFAPGCSCCVEPSDCTNNCDPPPPVRLFATFSGLSPSGTNHCACFDNGETYPVDYLGGAFPCQWFSDVGGPGFEKCTASGHHYCDVTLLLKSLTGGWSFEFGANDYSDSACNLPIVAQYRVIATAVETSCDPLEITFTNFSVVPTADDPTALCGTLADIVVTVTE